MFRGTKWSGNQSPRLTVRDRCPGHFGGVARIGTVQRPPHAAEPVAIADRGYSSGAAPALVW